MWRALIRASISKRLRLGIILPAAETEQTSPNFLALPGEPNRQLRFLFRTRYGLAHFVPLERCGGESRKIHVKYSATVSSNRNNAASVSAANLKIWGNTFPRFSRVESLALFADLPVARTLGIHCK